MPDRPPIDRDAIEEQAARCLAARDAGWTSAEAAAFARWRAADSRHEAAVCRLEAAQRLLRRLPESPAAAALLAELEALQPPARRVTRLSPWLTAAGALAAAACVAFAVWTLAPRPVSVVSFASAAGQHRTVGLTDGSTLLMNSGSEIDVEFLAGERRVNLRQGEVHFSVASDARRPFVVAAGSVRVRAVGTAFNVRLDPARIEVVVTEGRVQVSRDRTGPDDTIFLAAGESATIGIAPGSLPPPGRLAPETLREKLAWQAPRLTFDGTPLSEVVVQFNRYSPVQLELGDAELANRPVAGVFDGHNAEAFAGLLLTSGDVRVERVSDTRLVLRKAR